MAITIRKMKQPMGSSFLKDGLTFYRVKNDGVYVQDYKTKAEAQKRAKKLRRGI